MREISAVEEIQDIAYQILVKFHNFCEEHNLRYILAGGTLLGAVRHHDFIPWDDDIDVQMPRPDYERFLELTTNGIGENTAVVNWRTMEKPFFSFTKVIDTRTVLRESISIPNEIGIYIDVFPTDGLPDSKEEIDKKFKKLIHYKRLLILRTLKIQKGKSSSALIKKALLVPAIRLFYSPKQLISKIESIALQDDYEKSSNIAFQILGYNLKEVTQKDKFYTRVRMKFRDSELYIPSNYDEYLKSLFGNYLELPPLDEQVPHHSFVAFWRES